MVHQFKGQFIFFKLFHPWVVNRGGSNPQPVITLSDENWNQSKIPNQFVTYK